jgi:pSer/pThr/pTyr-binding forkhead associated (FHA) protein
MAASLVPTEGGNAILLDKPIMLIGRNQDCDISLQASSKVSRRHCCVVQCGERYLLRDLGSMNGVRVNSKRVVEAELKAGDEVAVADVGFTFRLDEVAAKPPGRMQQKSPEAAEASLPVAGDRDLLAIPLADEGEDAIPGEEILPPSDAEPLADDELRPSDSQSQAGFVRV